MEDISSEPAFLRGYHGTSKDDAVLIKVGKFFRLSTKSTEWLGDGIYFFENDKLEALQWAKYYKKANMPVVIESEISSQKLLDMCEQKNQKFIAKLIEELANKYKDEDREPEILDAKVINMVCAEVGYDVVRGIFEFQSKIFKSIEGFTRFKRYHIQLCVRNNDCINWDTLKGWDCNGNEIWEH